MVTFGGAYAVLAYVAQQAVENYHWLKPGEMLDGLGMAETTPGPLIMVLQFVGFMAAFRDPGASAADARRHARRTAGDLGDVHALLPVDLPRRAVHRGAARQQGAQRRAVGDHRRGGRRHPQSGDLVRHPHGVPGRPCRCAASASRSTRRCSRASTSGRWRLSAAAIVAIFRFKVGMMWTLAACSAAGIALYLLGSEREGAANDG